MRNHLNILFEDSHIIVCEKPHGTATQSRNISSADMVSLLKNHIRKTTGSTSLCAEYLYLGRHHLPRKN